MTVNIPGIIPGIYFLFLTTLKYMIGHHLLDVPIKYQSLAKRKGNIEGEFMFDNVYDIFNEFLTTYNLYPQPIPGYPGYQCDQ